MNSQDLELQLQATLAKKVNTTQCNNCEFFTLIDHTPTCEFTSLNFMDCLLVEIAIEKASY